MKNTMNKIKIVSDGKTKLVLDNKGVWVDIKSVARRMCIINKGKK